MVFVFFCFCWSFWSVCWSFGLPFSFPTAPNAKTKKVQLTSEKKNGAVFVEQKRGFAFQKPMKVKKKICQQKAF